MSSKLTLILKLTAHKMDYANLLLNITKTMHTGTTSCRKTEKLSLNRIFLASVGCLFIFVIFIIDFGIPLIAGTQYSQYYTSTLLP